MKRCICVLLVSTVLFGGCMNRNRVANTFVQVEKALAVAPDSAMRLLKDIPAKSLGNQAMRARSPCCTSMPRNVRNSMKIRIPCFG